MHIMKASHGTYSLRAVSTLLHCPVSMMSKMRERGRNVLFAI